MGWGSVPVPGKSDFSALTGSLGSCPELTGTKRATEAPVAHPALGKEAGEGSLHKKEGVELALEDKTSGLPPAHLLVGSSQR